MSDAPMDDVVTTDAAGATPPRSAAADGAPAPPEAQDRPARRRPAAVLAGWLGCTEGQALTAAIGLVVSLVLALVGIPPAVQDRPEASAGLVARPRGTAPVATPAPEAPGAATSPGDVPPAVGPVGDSALVGPSLAPSGGEPLSFADLLTSSAGALPSRPAAGISVFAPVPAPGAPEGVAVTADGTVYVATNNAGGRGTTGPGKLLRYSAFGDVERVYDVAGQAEGGAAALTGVAVDADGSVLVLDASTGRIVRVQPADGAQQVVATLFDLPACGVALAAAVCEPGAEDHPPLPQAVAVDDGGAVYVADAGQATIWHVPAGGRRAVPWHSEADYAARPLGGLAVDGDGGLVFSAGDLWRLAPGPAGRAGERTRVAVFEAEDGAAGVAVLADGGVAVALAGRNDVVVVAPDGTVRSRASDHAAGLDVAIDRPVGVAARGRSVLVTNRGDAGGEPRWAVLEMHL